MVGRRRHVELSMMLGLCVWLLAAISLCSGGVASSQLTGDFYATSCPNVYSVVRSVVSRAVQAEARMAASLLRLHFHDCFGRGCDGSVLLDGPSSEKSFPNNNNSARGFNVIDDIKSAVESACTGIVSCADILALTAEASVSLAGGPSWRVLLGRRDSTTPATLTEVLTSIALPTDSLETVTTKFSNKGLDTTDVVALLGAHTIGFARCVKFTDRLYNFSGTGLPDPSLDPTYRKILETTCPRGGDPDVLVPLDRTTPYTFDTGYYSNLRVNQGLLQPDQELYATGADTTSTVESFACDRMDFFNDFGVAMVNMGNISPLTGSDGEVRLNCRVANS